MPFQSESPSSLLKKAFTHQLEEYDSGMSLITAGLKELEERILLCLVHCFKAVSPSSLTAPFMYLDRTSWRQEPMRCSPDGREKVWETGGQPTLKLPPLVTYFSHLLKFPQLPQPAGTAGN